MRCPFPPCLWTAKRPTGVVSETTANAWAVEITLHMGRHAPQRVSVVDVGLDEGDLLVA